MDGGGTVTWPKGGKHHVIYMFQITLLLYRITLTLCRYMGEILMNLLDGEGEFTWPNGDRYRGGYVNGRRHA
jgi:hypothetical protein